jgi:hypothetical protein
VETPAVTNQEQARYWNGGEAASWLVHEERHERTAAWVSEALHAVLEPYVTLDGLLLGSRAWLVTASRPWQ